MGSFSSSPKIVNEDSQDNDVWTLNCETTTPVLLLEKCHEELLKFPPLLKRNFVQIQDSQPLDTDVRIMQWNILSQALGVRNDNFVACPMEALSWKTRRFRILEEILVYCPDVLCLQEVDHFNFLKTTLGSVGFSGTFFPKPDSPCIYIPGNNGPDGCAVFYNNKKFELINVETRVMEVWRVQSNQVAILAILRIRKTGQMFAVVTTHLKARQGALLSTLRNEQGKDLLEFVRRHHDNLPLVVCGDFNAEPHEAVYSTMLKYNAFRLASSYTFINNNNEPPYTTWKIREDGEVCHTIDYIFYSMKHFKVKRLLKFPTEGEMGENRVPCLQYPSDHFSLVCDVALL